MEKFIVPVALYFFFNLFMISSGQTPATVAPAVDCSALNTSEACCSAGNGLDCEFFSCSDDNSTVCVAAVNATNVTCTNTTVNPSKQCASPENCGDIVNNQTRCCDARNCIFVDCRENRGCFNNTENAGELCQNSTQQAVDRCVAAPAVNCTDQAELQSCCDADCVFIECQSKNSNSCLANALDCEGGRGTTYNCTQPSPPTPATPTTTAVPQTTQNGTDPGTSTEAPATPTAAPHSGGSGSGQSFDAASFIGGIVLCAGLVAIGYFGLKFYRARQDRNYHTL